MSEAEFTTQDISISDFFPPTSDKTPKLKVEAPPFGLLEACEELDSDFPELSTTQVEESSSDISYTPEVSNVGKKRFSPQPPPKKKRKTGKRAKQMEGVVKLEMDDRRAKVVIPIPQMRPKLLGKPADTVHDSLGMPFVVDNPDWFPKLELASG